MTTVTRTPLAPSEEEGKSQAAVAWDAVESFDADCGIGIESYIGNALKKAFPMMSGPGEVFVMEGKKYYRIQYDYVTETDYVTVAHPNIEE